MSESKFYKLILIVLTVCLMLSGCKKGPQGVVPPVSGTVSMQMRVSRTLNPALVENQSVRDVLSLCYEPLFVINDKMIPEGVLATGIEVAEDCMSAVVTLKESVLWHDGVGFTSADVVHTVNMLKEHMNSPYYGCVRYIDTVQPMGPLSFSMTFTRPYGQIACLLYFPIIPSHSENIDEEILGTGPYMVDSYSETTSLVLKKNDKWHGGDILCECVNVSIVRDNEIATSAFNSGSINTITGSSYDSENSAVKNNALITQYPSPEYEFMAFNHNREIFSSPAVRSAVSMAVDRSSIVKEVYTENAVAANSPIHPVAAEMAVDSGGSQYSLSGAGETLFLEGYTLNQNTGMLENEDGEKLSFTLLVNNDNPWRMKTAELLCSQLFLAGIDVKVKDVDFDTYLSEIQAGNYDAYLGGVTFANIYDYEFLLSDTGTLNTFGYVSEYMTAALDAVANASDKDKLAVSLVSFEEVFLREQPICGIAFKNGTLMTAENITGELSPYPGYPYKNIYKWNAG